jgi:hypothetical protein
MILNAKGNNFYFVFPKGFFPEAVTSKYLPYLKRQPVAYDSIPQMMNSTIQSITVPSIQMGTVEQTRYLGKKVRYKSSVPVQDLFSSDFSVTFKMLDGFLNYFVMMDTLLYFLNFKNADVHTMDLAVRLLDNDGNIITTIGFKDTILKSLGELQLNYTSNSPENQTFSLGFTCNFIDIVLEAKKDV